MMPMRSFRNASAPHNEEQQQEQEQLLLDVFAANPKLYGPEVARLLKAICPLVVAAGDLTTMM
jgi:hypothetical protein